MKKGIALVTTLLLLIGLLAGCGSAGDGKKVKLVVWGDRITRQFWKTALKH